MIADTRSESLLCRATCSLKPRTMRGCDQLNGRIDRRIEDLRRLAEQARNEAARYYGYPRQEAQRRMADALNQIDRLEGAKAAIQKYQCGHNIEA